MPNSFVTNKSILALDFGTHMGWALKDKKNKISSGSKNLLDKNENKKYKLFFKENPLQKKDLRYLLFYEFLLNFKDINIISFEQVRKHKGTEAGHVYGGFHGILKLFSLQYKIPVIPVPVQTIKKYITGYGNAKKEDVYKYLKLLKYNPKDYDEADALALLQYNIYKLKCVNKKGLEL